MVPAGDSQLVVIDRVFGWIQYNLVGIVAEFSKMTVVPMNIGGRSSTSETGQSELWRTYFRIRVQCETHINYPR